MSLADTPRWIRSWAIRFCVNSSYMAILPPLFVLPILYTPIPVKPAHMILTFKLIRALNAQFCCIVRNYVLNQARRPGASAS